MSSQTKPSPPQPPEAQPSPKETPSTETPPQEPGGGFDRWPLYLAIALGTILLDQGTKIWAKASLEPMFPEAVVIIPGLFQLIYAENTGAAFSLLRDRVGILALISLVAAVLLTTWFRRIPAREVIGRGALALVLGGAVGNLIDRVLRGYVVDFFDAYWKTHHWPTFNVADSAICVGVGLLFLRTFQGKV